LTPLRVPMAPRNAMPSLHFSAALLVYWNTLGMRRASRIAAGLFLAGTAFATLALGEHYLIDLIVAFPFSLMFQAVFTDAGHGNSALKRRTALGGAGLLTGWLIALRFWVRPLVAWPVALLVACILTLGSSILAQRALSRVGSGWRGCGPGPQ
jgi:hypothetical protein